MKTKYNRNLPHLFLLSETDYFITVRDDNEKERIIYYIIENPVNAGLVENWDDWKGTYYNPDYL
ncbi:MAG: hypothetical protein FVQ77_08740 [Cytophagales bacterium]|nr:hypothetical protein [Cytophagales bacterium]